MPSYRETFEAHQESGLSPHACRASASRGRVRPEPQDPVRTCFQRDRDRIIHCKAFRRLAHKTQVFLRPEGDHYRTRMSHTLEMMQIARSISRALGLNEDLTEAIALGHDLGHTPFGHAGEAVLNRLLPGGFHHVQQSVRVVEVLELEGRGLNLTHEVREGIALHSKGRGHILPRSGRPAGTLEAQVARVADIIAYLNHDLDDAERARILALDEIPPDIQEAVGVTSSSRITHMINDVLQSTDLQRRPRIQLSEGCNQAMVALRAFLYQRVYDNPSVHGEIEKAERVLEVLWESFVGPQAELFRARHWPAGLPAETPLPRAVADFLAGMTDRYALRLFEELYLPRSWSVL